MTRFLPLIGTIIVGILAAFEPSTKDWVGKNPEFSATIGVVIAAILNLLRSPVQK